MLGSRVPIRLQDPQFPLCSGERGENGVIRAKSWYGNEALKDVHWQVAHPALYSHVANAIRHLSI